MAGDEAADDVAGQGRNQVHCPDLRSKGRKEKADGDCEETCCFSWGQRVGGRQLVSFGGSSGLPTLAASMFGLDILVILNTASSLTRHLASTFAEVVICSTQRKTSVICGAGGESVLRG